MQHQGNYYYNNQGYNQGYNQNYVNRGSNPARFATFSVLPDQSGFMIPGCNYVFNFDAEGGWYDEFGNYYNADGNPSHPPPIYSEDDVDDQANQLASEYDMGDEDYEDQALKQYDKIFLNIENKKLLNKFLKDQEINVTIKSMSFQCTEDDFEKFLISKKIDWIEFEFEYDQRNRFTGTCYLIIDKQNAEKLIELNGQKYLGRDLRINIQKPEKANSDEEDIDVHELGIEEIAEALKSHPGEEQKTSDNDIKHDQPPINSASGTTVGNQAGQNQQLGQTPVEESTPPGEWGKILKKPKNPVKE